MSIAGREDQVVTEWLLNADQFKGELKQLATDIRKQAREENELISVRKRLAEETLAAAKAKGVFAGAVAEAKVKLEELSVAGIKVADIMKGGALFAVAEAAVSKLGDAFMFAKDKIVEMASELRRLGEEGMKWLETGAKHEKVLGAMQDATKYLMEDSEALRLKKRLEAAGIRATADEWGNLAKVVMEGSVIWGTDMASAADRVTDALVNVRGRGLKALIGGFKESGDAAADKARMLSLLIERGSSYSVQLETTAKVEKSLTTQMEDAYRDLGAAGEKAFGIIGGMHAWEEQKLQFKIQLYRGLIDVVGQLQKAYLMLPGSTDTGAVYEDLRKRREQVKNYEYGEQQFLRGYQALGKATRQANEDVTFNEMSNFGAGWGGDNLKSAARRGGPAREQKDWGNIGDAARTEAMLERRIKDLKEATKAAEADAKAQAEILKTTQHQVKTLDEINRHRKITELDKYLKGLDEQIDKHKKIAEAYNEQKKAMIGLAVSASGEFASGMLMAADAAILSGEGFGTAMFAMTKSTILGIAEQALIKVPFEIAEGFAAAGRWDYPSAAQHWAAAAQYGVVAGVAGAAGLAMSAAGVGKQDKGAGAAKTPKTTADSTRPSFGEKKSNQPIVINANLYLGDGNDPGAALMMTKQIQASLGRVAA